MLLVILGHSVHFWTGDWFVLIKPVYESKLLALISTILSSFPVYCFVLISGYIFYFKTNESDSYLKLSILLKKKAKRLIVPYYFVICVWCIPIYLSLGVRTSFLVLNRLQRPSCGL